jgi:HAD superfamily hydrolase (TIGR01490 family)
MMSINPQFLLIRDMTNKVDKYRTAAFFDLDSTIIDRNSFRYFLAVYHFSKWTKWIYVPWVLIFGILRKLRIISLQTFKEKALISLVGKSDTSIRQIGKSFIEKHLLDIIRKRAVIKIRQHRELGHFTFIITSCPDIYIFALAEHLNCDGYECSRLAYRNGRFIGRILDRDCFGSEKVMRLKAIVENSALDLSRSYAYSDHQSDLPLLELVGRPVAVTPTEQMRRMAIDRGWEIEEW